jgi:crotonobetainyl-CoA:carnitine CoA-transferase CaiB-like acyl-CoA transferase|tara:strand:+ start:1134 stop:2252 length:1119 start_codon:yes stop_codon:yes gene_type:complete
MPLRILEFGDNYAAGYAGKLFARWGAEVIRVDAVDTEPAFPHRTEHTAVDLYLHAGKTRMAIDYGKPAGRQLLHRLAAKVDILITDLSAADLDLLDWTSLGGSDLKIRTAITPFGLQGPRRDWVATSNVLLAMGGQTFLMGDPGRAPLTMPGRYIFYQSGQYAYTASLATHRLQPTDTQTIDVSMYETALSLHQFTTVMWTFGGNIRSRHGNDFGVLHPITMYPCKDGWFAVNADILFWDAFTIMLGKPELADDPQFATVAARVENCKELDAIVMEQLGDKTRREVLDLGQEVCRMPTGILTTLDELLQDPHLEERDFWQTIAVDGRELKVPGSAFRYVGESPPAQPKPKAPVDAGVFIAPSLARAGESSHD